jgi:filamentous hemagglutinin family protein
MAGNPMMTAQDRSSKQRHNVRVKAREFRLAPVAGAIAVMLATSGMASSASAQQVFSRAWYGKQQQQMQQMRATGVLPNGQPVTAPQQQQQLAQDKLKDSIHNLNRAAQMLAARMSQQQLARQGLAANTPTINVTNGVGGNGLVVDLSKAWQNATLNTPVTTNGQTKVTIDQTDTNAIAYWNSFNVGKDTHVHFDQHGNTSWSILNKVSNSVAPSQIQGKITADGTVLIVNNNGVVFSGSSQVNVRNLVAAAANISDAQFNTNGLYSTQSGSNWLPTFTDAAGSIVVQQGAQITTNAPGTNPPQGGGYVLLAGQQVLNEGEIQANKGQVQLVAGDHFIIKKGVSTEGNFNSTTKGNEVDVRFNAGSTAGLVVNQGLLVAQEGDVTLTGHDVQQDGTVTSTTSVNTRGTIHLNAVDRNGDHGQVKLAADSLTAIVLDNSTTTALDSQRDALSTPVVTDTTTNLDALPDRRDQSRIEINTSGNVTFEGDSLTLATGGQIAVNADQQIFVADKATLDVSGAVGVSVAMESNNILVNVQGNELRDSPQNRDNGGLSNQDVWIDRRELILVPAGTGGYETDRWYTADGLLEVSGYLGNQGHTIGEWAAQGGTVTLAGKEVVTQAGSTIRIAGGSLDVNTGYVSQTWLKGIDGKLYTLKNLPAGMVVTGVHKGFEVSSERWGVTKTYYNPLMAANKALENGYTVGRDAGELIISAPTAVLEGNVDAQVFNGAQQSRVRDALSDGYYQAQTAVAKQGTISLGEYNLTGRKNAFSSDIKIGDVADITQTMAAGDAVSSDRVGTVWFDADKLNGMQLGGLDLATRGTITVADTITLADGANISLTGADVVIGADITTKGGTISAGNTFVSDSDNSTTHALLNNGSASLTLKQGVTLDTSGQWVTGVDAAKMPYLNGGNVSLSSSHDVVLEQGSLINVSSGGAVSDAGKQTGGKGGNVTLIANAINNTTTGGGTLTLDGAMQSYGVNGGGKLLVDTAGKVVLGDTNQAAPGTLALGQDVFASGFAQYDINGQQGLVVADGAVIDVAMPVYRFTDAGDALVVWAQPQFIDDTVAGKMIQRKGADLTLRSVYQKTGGDVVIGEGAIVSVDQGRVITLVGNGAGSVLVNGTLNAWGGDIAIQIDGLAANLPNSQSTTAHDRAIVIGEHAVLDVAARAVTGNTADGRHYGIVRDGGTIHIGGDLDWEGNGQSNAPDVAIVVHAGAVLDASGTQGLLNTSSKNSQIVASDGGEIVLKTLHSLYLDGTFKAAAGGAGAAGGTLAVAMDTPAFAVSASPDDAVRSLKEIILTQDFVHSGIDQAWVPGQADAAFQYGTGRLSVEQVQQGGFDHLSVLVNGMLSFDGNIDLATKQSIRLYAGSYALAETAQQNAAVRLSTSYLRLAGSTTASSDGTTVYDMTWRQGASSRVSDATFTAKADLIDIRDRVGFGAGGSIQLSNFTSEQVDRRGFAEIDLTSQGDMRLLSGTAARGLTGNITTELSNTGDVTITAAQIYPVTNASAQIIAGAIRTNSEQGFNTGSVLDIRRTAGTEASVPLSVFGSLRLAGDTVSQGGVVWAPYGNISFATYSNQTLLKADSLTSVSGAGLVMPYGGTMDGTSYTYAGTQVTPNALGSSNIVFGANSTVSEAGSTLDLSGGGTLLGAAFVGGRGGSVNIIDTPLANAGPVHSYSDASNQVYAIVPTMSGVYAPVVGDTGAGNPQIGKQITLTEDIGGLKAGTYTLLPSTFAMVPGAYRIELSNDVAMNGMVAATSTGSYVGSGYLGVANTDIRAKLANKVIVTPMEAVKLHSGFNTTSYDEFIRADVQRHGGMRGQIGADAGSIILNYATYRANGLPMLQLDGEVELAAQANSDGFGGTVFLDAYDIEILAAGQQATQGWSGISVHADSLTAFNAPRLVIGGNLKLSYGSNYAEFTSATNNVVVRSGAELTGADVFLVNGYRTGAITVEEGASISTIGAGKSSYDSSDGVTFSAGKTGVLAVSNGWINMLGSESQEFQAPGQIHIGSCVSVACDAPTKLLSEGTLVVATNKAFTLADNVTYGAKNLLLAISSINMGSEDTLAQASANGQLPQGLSLNQSVLQKLLKGNQAEGVVAVNTLVLNAAESINMFGNVAFDTTDANSGLSSIERFVLGTPAIYGYGDASDVASIKTGEFIWTGSKTPAGAAVGGLLGNSTFNIEADRIILGQAPNTRVNGIDVYDRTTAGFGAVNLIANESIAFDGKGTLSVYHAQGNALPQGGYSYTGGDLLLSAPVITGASGASLTVTAGGQLHVLHRDGTQAATTNGLGASLALAGQTVTVDGNITLASGKLNLTAQDDVVLKEDANIDLAGRAIHFYEETRYSRGGDVIVESKSGNITQESGSLINVSAVNNRGGSLKFTALGDTAGHIDLAGTIQGSGNGWYEAGGTLVPYLGAELALRAQSVTDFAALNTMLNDGEVFGARQFQLKQGNLVIGNEVKAHHVEIVVDGGHLTVNGKIDASGVEVGKIRLVARDDLTVNGELDAHGTGLRLDSYDKIIDSPNRAIVDLTTRTGTLALSGHAKVDLRTGTQIAGGYQGDALGTLDLNAPRVGNNDVAVSVDSAPTILGANTVAVNAFRTYDDAPLASVPDVTGTVPQLITQAYLDGIDANNITYMTAALQNTALQQRLSLLDDAKLRPGVEIVSNATTNPAGNLTVAEDIDLSNYRYGPDADRNDPAKRGFGEPGVLVIRAAGDLTFHGSLNDGFAPPVATPDDAGWLLAEYRPALGDSPLTPYGIDIVVPIDGVVLDIGTIFPMDAVLNYDISVKGLVLPLGLVLPTAVTLATAYTLPAGLVLDAAVTRADGTIIPAATVLQADVVLGAGDKLGAGSRLRADVEVGALIWPKGFKLPRNMTSNAQTTLARGALIPGMTRVELVDNKPIDLRPKINGKQGANWAVATMLNAGASSWDIQLTAGADLQSSDIKATNVDAKGSVVLADSHFLMDATVVLGGSGMVWTAAGASAIKGDATLVGTVVDQSDWDSGLCATTGMCEVDPKRITKYWSEAAPANRTPHTPVATSLLAQCRIRPAYCYDVVTAVFDEYKQTYYGPTFSVLRTGAADLGINAARDLTMNSPYGVYTAGTQSAAILNDQGVNLYNQARGLNGATVLGTQTRDYSASLANYAAWYPEHGGNLDIVVGRNIVGDGWGDFSSNSAQTVIPSATVGNWLWRQGTGSTAEVTNAIPTAWWINFGSYSLGSMNVNVPYVAGFTGVGTMGGGNLTITAGGDIGITDVRGQQAVSQLRSQGLNMAIGSTGRVDADGHLVLTGGGDLSLRIAGAVNPDFKASQHNPTDNPGNAQTLALNGTVTNLRGLTQISAQQIGTVQPIYRASLLASPGIEGDATDTRPIDPFQASVAKSVGGLTLMPGDSAVYLDALGDLVLGTAGDPGRVFVPNSTGFDVNGVTYAGNGQSWFSLWTKNTAINLFSAGGNMTPGTDMATRATAYINNKIENTDYVYPSILRVTAAAGSIYYGLGAYTANIQGGRIGTGQVLAPSATGTGALELLAADNIYGGGSPLKMSGASNTVPTPFNPAFGGYDQFNTLLISNGSLNGTSNSQGVGMSAGYNGYPLFVFGPDSIGNTDLYANTDAAALFYASKGDIVGLTSGAIENRNYGDIRTWYRAATPVRVKAGRDIVSADVVAVNNDATDVSLLQAGRDILYANVRVAGPGTLELLAGRHITQDNVANVQSLGAIVSGDNRAGADIAVMAGMAEGADFTAIRKLYLDPQYQADNDVPLSEQSGKVAKTYENELADWLDKRYGFSGDTAQALAYFDTLAPEQQRIFLRDVYYSELKAGAREFNNPDSRRYQSYLRSRQMIATLFPDQTADGQTINRIGNFTMYGDAGIQTYFGGDIQMMAPGGQIILGRQQESVPASTAGLVTQGNGDIALFSEQSLMLGLSRIMTTYGGNIFGWSEEGDINAGRGAKTTVVYTPPKRVYDMMGNVELAPQVPSSGAGIATLNPVPEVPAGDVDLVAPLGTIDAGEAGIRVSGSINVIANQLVNADNIKVQGDSAGIPMIAAANIGALTSATAASSAAATGAQEMLQRDRANARDNLPSVFTVRVLGFGNEPAARAEEQSPLTMQYNNDSRVQVVGRGGKLNPALLSQLSDEERSLLQKP